MLLRNGLRLRLALVCLCMLLLVYVKFTTLPTWLRETPRAPTTWLPFLVQLPWSETTHDQSTLKAADKKGPIKDKATSKWNEVFSISTKSKTFFNISLAGVEAFNPNILPHPSRPRTYIVVAQSKIGPDTVSAVQIACNAVFVNDVLVCISGLDGNDASEDMALAIEPTTGKAGSCEGDDGKYAFLSLNKGPHDARLFHGPKSPLIMYGSNSQHTCFGQYGQDFRSLYSDWPADKRADMDDFKDSKAAVEVLRPLPWRVVEKNWFIFWDGVTGQSYVHHDLLPNRVFAELDIADGSVGQDLAPLASVHDSICMALLMPSIGPEQESIHQSTNSLSITMCSRSDPSCRPTNENTFIFVIFQHKLFHDFHSVYEPYVMVFRQTPPFQVYGITRKPLWISGRGYTSTGQSEMFYVVSMSWAKQGQTYHGYLDDPLFLAFGIEDDRSGGIDVRAGSLFVDLELCANLTK